MVIHSSPFRVNTAGVILYQLFQFCFPSIAQFLLQLSPLLFQGCFWVIRLFENTILWYFLFYSSSCLLIFILRSFKPVSSENLQSKEVLFLN